MNSICIFTSFAIVKRVEPNWAIECADYATVLGNDFTIDTYRYAKKPIYRIPISTCGQYPWNENKDFEAVKKNYLWIGSSGLVHKGLDLVVEAFAKMPDYNLFICGPILQNDVSWQDKDFEREYFKELHQTSNIHTIGWIDVNSSNFKELTNKCLGIIYPSCAEGGGGSVINCMHAALLPIVSYESSVDVGDFGVILKTNTIAEIQNTIKMVSALPDDKLKYMSRCTWDFVRKNHTREFPLCIICHDYVDRMPLKNIEVFGDLLVNTISVPSNTPSFLFNASSLCVSNSSFISSSM